MERKEQQLGRRNQLAKISLQKYIALIFKKTFISGLPHISYLISHVSFSLLLFSLTACQKEQIEIPINEVQTTTNYTLNDVFFLDENIGYACGGDRYNVGVFMKTKDGGKTWSSADSIMPKQSYAIHFFDQKRGFVTGFDSWFCSTDDSAKNFGIYYMPAYLPTYDLKFQNNTNGVMAGGAGLNSGTIYNTKNGGGSWNEQRFDFNLQCAAWVNDMRVMVAGYGVLYVSNDAGETWRAHDDVRGDFFKDICFPTAQTGFLIGWQGMILKTSNGGDTWQKLQSANSGFNKRIHLEAIDFFDENTGAIVGDDGLMYITDNAGKTWKQAKQFTNLNLYDVHLFNAKSGIACGEAGKVFLFNF